MARRRFFVDRIVHSEALLEGDEAAHLTRVLRVEAGQRYEISDNAQAYLAEVVEARKAQVRFRVLEEIQPGPELPPLTLLAALTKFDRFEWMIEKTTELGIARIVPLETVRSDTGLFRAAQKRVERWRKIAREASQQCRRLRIPEIADPLLWREAMSLVFTRRYWLEEEPGPPLLVTFHQPHRAGDEAALLVGAEGGWTGGEREQLTAAGWLPVSLGPTILRAETAAIAAVSTMVQLWFSGEG